MANARTRPHYIKLAGLNDSVVSMRFIVLLFIALFFCVYLSLHTNNVYKFRQDDEQRNANGGDTAPRAIT